MGDIFSVVLLIVFAWSVVGIFTKKNRLENRRIADIKRKYSELATQEAILKKQVWQGMSREQLVDSWGNPSGVTQQRLKTKIKETYRFGSNRYGSSVYLENGAVTGWRQPK